MSYDTEEKSRYSGAPVEFFKFTYGATTLRQTSGDAAASIADPSTSHEYMPAAISRTEMDHSSEDSAGDIRVTVELDHAVAVLFRDYLPTTPVALTIYRRHRGDSEVVVEFIGTVTSVAADETHAVLTCAPISQLFKRQLPALPFQRPCPYALYGAGCTVDKTGFKDTATLSFVDGVTIKSTTFDARADGWYENGWVERANGQRRMVVKHFGDSLTLVAPFSTDLVAGASVDAYAGCDRTEATCATKFNNLVNHLGFARIPNKNPHGGVSIY